MLRWANILKGMAPGAREELVRAAQEMESEETETDEGVEVESAPAEAGEALPEMVEGDGERLASGVEKVVDSTTEALIAQLISSNKELEAKVEALEKQGRVSAGEEWASALVKSNRILPAQAEEYAKAYSLAQGVQASEDGSRTLANVLDELASEQPAHEWTTEKVPSSTVKFNRAKTDEKDNYNGGEGFKALTDEEVKEMASIASGGSA